MAYLSRVPVPSKIHIMLFKKHSDPPQRQRRVVQQPQRNVVFSYHANRSVRTTATGRNSEEPAQLRQAPRFPWVAYLPHIIGGIAVVVITVLGLRVHANAHIVAVGDASKHVFLRETPVYQEAAARAFATPANSNKLTINTDAIIRTLKKQFPELTTVSISLPVMGNTPTVYVQPAMPVLILATQQNGLQVLDSDGRALITANQAKDLDKRKLPVVTDESGLSIATGKVALPRTNVAFIEEVVWQLRQKGVDPASLTLPAGASELRVRIDGAGYFIKFNTLGNAREQVGGYLALKDHLAKERKAPKEYIDVRVEGRAYYK